MQASYAWNKEKYNLTVAHWCAKEGRFRRHIKRIKEDQAADLIKLDNLILCVEQKDVVNKRYLKSDARAYVPDYGTYILAQDPNGNPVYLSLSRQMVLFVIERRKAWRMMQSRAGQENIDYATQREIIAKLESGDIARDDVWEKGAEALQEEAGEPEAVEN
jgi:pyruvate-ferredoxin/flavodoxin oxidoreductase